MSGAARFTTSPPGLEPHRDFAREPLEGTNGVYVLEAAGDPGIRLFVVDADRYLPGYAGAACAGSAGAEALAAIGVDRLADAEVLLVTSLQEDGPAVNLRAPVVVARADGRAVQLILDDPRLALRIPLAAAAMSGIPSPGA